MNDLFNPDKAYHRTDPVTSGDAAEGVLAFAGWHYRKIMEALTWGVTHGPYSNGMLALEITKTSGLEYLQVVRRLSELQRAGKIINTGQTRRNPNGRRATVWSVA